MASMKTAVRSQTFMSLCRCGARFQGTGRKAEQARRAAAQHVCPPRDEPPRTYWLSFCDTDKPKGQQCLGACVVDVTRAEADDALIEVALRFPLAQEGAEWIAAAVRKAHVLGCNPGGEVASVRIDGLPSFPQHGPRYPRGRLLSRVDVAALEPSVTDDAVARAGPKGRRRATRDKSSSSS